MLFLEVKVFPKSRKSAIEIDKSGMVRCYVTSAPENGKANREVIKLLAKKCSVRQQDVSIKRGIAARNKYIVIDVDMTFEEFLALCNSGVQSKLC